MICLDKETAAAYISGDLEPELAEQCAIHVAECATCRALVEGISEMIDRVRQYLLLMDVPVTEAEIPPVEAIKARAAPPQAPSRAWFHRMTSIVGRTGSAPAQGKTPPRSWRLLRQRRWIQAMVAGVVVIAVVMGVQFFTDRQSISAEEILQRAERATINARTLPDRIVRRVWEETIKNGLGPLPDGQYRFEYWWDNVRNRFAYFRHNRTGSLIEANWNLEGGVGYVFRDYPGRGPEVTLTPSHQEIAEEIERLPQGLRDAVRAYHQQHTRPFVEVALELLAEKERELADVLAKRKDNATAQAVMLANGRKGYWVSFHVDTPPGWQVERWDVSQLILDGTYAVVEHRAMGYRTDGLVYERHRTFLGEQVFFPGEPDPKVFSPGPFPEHTKYRHVSPEERVKLIIKLLPNNSSAR